ncbi:Small nuclear RNA activating complex (SNAPc) subunit SNAP43 [Carpediemonas membranifera]|uniref:Small nuclear RNA activating complex (SNAPc) subunit SNAP43 n=1 Tax=Carpediemonas membranifera TaxID=201153 RepID=A0A8J6E0Y4_9EUKA|nr:Small nuclear RNA activating complex (SNAPc) subunit SNAP43 [Carpediemonas membranifera]|eukprot:KAG9392426.1 Small nuclear RNA activating complex (SNAPc) subunit SNAP43 [Carpediemonas membranifera]
MIITVAESRPDDGMIPQPIVQDVRALLRLFASKEDLSFAAFRNSWGELLFSRLFTVTVSPQHHRIATSCAIIDTAVSILVSEEAATVDRIGALYTIYSVVSVVPSTFAQLSPQELENVTALVEDLIKVPTNSPSRVLHGLRAEKRLAVTMDLRPPGHTLPPQFKPVEITKGFIREPLETLLEGTHAQCRRVVEQLVTLGVEFPPGPLEELLDELELE